MVEVKTYPIIEVPHFTDGDTLWVRREWHAGWVDTVELVARDDRAGICIRLHDGDLGVNTPEEGKPGYVDAATDLRTYVEDWGADRLTLRTYGLDKYGRLLGDLVPTVVVDHPSGVGATWHMREEMKWPAYKK